MPWSEFGIAFQRFEGTSFEVKLRNDWWGANEWARYPDIYDNYKKWIALRNETWSEEMNTLEVRMIKGSRSVIKLILGSRCKDY